MSRHGLEFSLENGMKIKDFVYPPIKTEPFYVDTLRGKRLAGAIGLL